MDYPHKYIHNCTVVSQTGQLRTNLEDI